MSTNTAYQMVNNLSVLKFSGTEASSFLQGQLSNDVNALSASWQYTGYCNPKGRLLALFQLWRDDTDFYATLDSSILDATVKRLRMYVMRSDVVIEEITAATCAGTSNAEEAQPNEQRERFNLDIENAVHTLHFGTRTLSIDLNGAPQTTETLDWQALSIAAGEPNIDAGNVELFVPQMVNLDLLEGVNFKKGCYTGQEIVARMHYLGKLKQRMFVCQLEGNTTSGDKVLAGEKSAGNIVSVSGDKVLAVIRKELLGSNLSTASGAKIVPLEKQPYLVPD